MVTSYYESTTMLSVTYLGESTRRLLDMRNKFSEMIDSYKKGDKEKFKELFKKNGVEFEKNFKYIRDELNRIRWTKKGHGKLYQELAIIIDDIKDSMSKLFSKKTKTFEESLSKTEDLLKETVNIDINPKI